MIERGVGLLRLVTFNLLAALAICTGSASASAGELNRQEESEAPKYGLERVVEELESELTIAPQSLLEALLVGGPRALPELFAALDGRPGTAANDVRELAPDRLKTYAQALRLLPGWVNRSVDPTSQASHLDVLRVETALSVLEESDEEGACAEAIALVSPEQLDAEPNQLLVKRLERALSVRLAREPREARELDEAMEITHPALRPAIVRAAGDAPSTEAAEFLTRVLADDSSLDLLVLTELARVLAVTHEACGGAVEMKLGLHLSSSTVALRREACLAVGRLELFDLTEPLIDLLADEDFGVRVNAHWALEEVTGKKMQPDPTRWHAWHDGELRWWSNDAQAAFTKLNSSEAHEISAGIRALSGHRHYRHEIAEELLPLLFHEKNSIVAQVCAALGALGSGKAVPALREALDHDTATVREAAWRALKSVTGRSDLPADPQAWANIWG